MHTEKGHKYEILSNGKLMKCMYSRVDNAMY